MRKTERQCEYQLEVHWNKVHGSVKFVMASRLVVLSSWSHGMYS
jgi:hypothetical protein